MTDYQIAQCGRCNTKRIVYRDIHPKAFTCPKCCQVQGVIWKDTMIMGKYNSMANCDPFLRGEDEYDWTWLDYDKVNKSNESEE